MKELLSRLSARPWLTFELLVASLFASILALASPLFVMQVLNRYVAHGVDTTLWTLTAGVIAAIALEFGFRQVRHRMAAAVSRRKDEELARHAYSILTGAKASAVDSMPHGLRREVVAGVESVQAAYGPTSICAMLDVPMAIVFVFALWLLSPMIAAVVSGFIVLTLGMSLLLLGSLKKPTQDMTAAAARRGGLVSAAIGASDTVRAFNVQEFLRRLWMEESGTRHTLRAAIGGRQNLVQSIMASAQALTGVAVIAIGAMLVVRGQFDVGMLIGANIMAARALGPIARIGYLTREFARARQALEMIREFAKLPMERMGGTTLDRYYGAVEFKNAGFSHPGSKVPLFDGLNLKIEPGSTVVVAGGNGSGKTTMARLLVGLLEPRRGQIAVDGVDLQQIDKAWWRRQIVYLPQEPRFIAGSIKANIMAMAPDMNEATLERLIVAAGLKAFVEQSPRGLDTEIANGGDNLSLGIRRRLALARALATDGMLCIFDEPTEGLDAAGTAQMYAVMNDLVRRGRTIVALCHDPNIVKGANLIVDLNVKPVPRVIPFHVPPGVDIEAAGRIAAAAKAGIKEVPK